MGDITDLANDLRENGQIQAICVRPPSPAESEAGISEPWVLVAGGRRLAAAMTLGWMQIAATVRYDDIGEIRHRVLELHENLKRLNMTWQEEADAKAEILRLRQVEQPGITAGQVAKEIGDNAASFSRAVAASDAMAARPELRQASSRKAALRAADVADQLEARKRADETNRKAIEEVETRIATDDAVNFLQKYEDFFDLVITDPPYGIDFWQQGQKTDAESNLSTYDDSPQAAVALYEEMIPALARACRDTAWVLMFGSAESYRVMEATWRGVCKDHKLLGCQLCMHLKDKHYQPETIPWIWYRPNSRNRPRFPERNAQNQYEYILVVNMGSALLAKPTGNVFVFDAEYGNERFHGNQKPVELIKELISCCAYPGDRFCDPCHGSGAHLAAAASSSLVAYGCDLNPAMRAPALGLVAKHFKPIPESVRDLAQARLMRKLGELTFGVTEGKAAEK
jgi:ParB-like chromosome segregation protein Spo0J